MSEEPKSKSLEIGLGIFILLGLIAAVFIWQDVTGRHRGRSRDQMEATSNARQVGLALFEFETEYGAFPSPTTKPLVEKNPGSTIDLSGTSSNALFRQLFAMGYTPPEQMFFAKMSGIRKPDNIITPGNILEPGENGFAYISGLSTKDDPTTPLALTPPFDPKPFNGKAIVLHIDNSVRSYDIQKDGHIYDKGINLLSPKHPIWGGKSPEIHYPDL